VQRKWVLLEDFSDTDAELDALSPLLERYHPSYLDNYDVDLFLLVFTTYK
jgi:hypothetical protein